MSEESKQWRWIERDVIAVKISPELQLKPFGLALAIRKIPLEVRKGISGYWWEGAVVIRGQRWGHIGIRRATP